ncbi:MAG: DNA-3-methyladenine glycosylase I [Clostridia bacterium]
MKRCDWKNLNSNPIYIEYHDNEWGIPSYDDNYLFEMILLESFHCGLSWLIILQKREHFRTAFDNFDAKKIAKYDDIKVSELLTNSNIVRSEAKIRANIQNAKSFLNIQHEYGSFCKYIWSFTENKVIFRKNDELYSKNELSDLVSKDLKRRGFKFMGSVTTLSYLEAIGVLNNHTSQCFKHIDA